MAYGSEGLEGRGQRGGRLQDDSRAYRNDVEEEPTDLDAPESDGLDDDELEDVAISASAGGDDDADEDDDAEEAASPLAEDAPVSGEDEDESEADADDEEPESAPAGRGEAAVMSHGARRRQFPIVAKTVAKAAKGAAGTKRPAGPRRKTRRVKLARA